jgi:glutamate-1-semialdehyde 2,1-aminomutase
VIEAAAVGTGALLGGISSSFRVNSYIGRALTLRRAEGAYIETTDGARYIDFFLAHAGAILGHAHPAVVAGVRDALDCGVVSGYETGLAGEVAEILASAIPSAERVRFVASGSEAVRTALRLARAYTGRDVIIKMDGHFNGGSDYVLFNNFWRYADPANEGGHTSTLQRFSAGIPHAISETLVVVPWNDLTALAKALSDNAGRIAAVLMNPIDYNNGCITTTRAYLEEVRRLTTDQDVLLIFDEVLSGFRTGLSCAQGYYGVTPDITTLSKALSSGVPLSAIVGLKHVMERLTVPAPDGALQGGTFAGNILGLAAARATLNELSDPGFYPRVHAATDEFCRDLQAIFDGSPVPAHVQWLGNMYAIYVGTREPITGYRQLQELDQDRVREFFCACIDRGVWFQHEFMISGAHDDGVRAEALTRIEDAVRWLSDQTS